jgi:Transposase DDE domain group 1
MELTPFGVWHYYDGRTTMEPRICQLREDYALRKIPTGAFATSTLYLEILRLAYNLVTAFQRTCLEESWQSLTVQKLRYKLFLLPANRPVPRTGLSCASAKSPVSQDLAEGVLRNIHRLRSIQTR